MTPSRSSLQDRLREADQLLRARNPEAAEKACAAILSLAPANHEARLILARARQMQNDTAGMLENVELLLQISPDSVLARLMKIEALSALGRIDEARTNVGRLKGEAHQDAALLGRIAEIETQLGEHQTALTTLRRAIGLQPENNLLLYNLANEELATGDLDGAERHLDELITRAPADYDAYYNRSTLRRQTAERNHVGELSALLEGARGGGAGEIPLCYSLAKELEDLGEFERSFSYLKRGADMRRKLMVYRVENDIAAIEQIAAVFDDAYFAKDVEGCEEQGPIFIVGLPRSGTTLVDRILSSHPEVCSVGEVNDLALAIMQGCRGASSKTDLIYRSAHMNMKTLGETYRNSTVQRAKGARSFIIDKTPLDFLYLGLIAKALPNAKIIHVGRDPMDVGFALYKTLFRMGYPFSYDLGDIARYMRAQERLMEHWSRKMGERIVTVSYEALVSDLEAQTRKLLSSLGLEWRAECLAFHENASPSATASAAQVRRPIYKTSVGKWKCYEANLRSLREALSL